MAVAPFIEPSILISCVIPQLDDNSLLILHRTNSLMTLLDKQHQFQEHLMSRSLLLIKQLDNDKCVDRLILYKLAQEYHRSDIMIYAKQQGYTC